MAYEPVIGLEIHVQLATRSKLFSGASTRYGAEPNVQASAVDLGLPGVLPVINEAAVRMAVKFGLAVNARIAPVSVFARKNYFYPDLPKGYQISQYDLPLASAGRLTVATGEGPVLVQRMEVTALDRLGREFPVELSITATVEAGEPLGGVVRVRVHTRRGGGEVSNWRVFFAPKIFESMLEKAADASPETPDSLIALGKSGKADFWLRSHVPSERVFVQSGGRPCQSS